MSSYSNILVAVDLSPTAGGVCEKAASLAKLHGALLTVLYVAEYVPPLDIAYEPVTPADWMVDEGALVRRATESLNALIDALGISDATRLVELGIPKQTILHTAQERGCDLIIVGSHGRHGIGRLLGSTANSILHNATCDVLAIRIQDRHVDPPA